MADISDLIYYFRTLKKGFDQEIFKAQVNLLAQAVDSSGLNYEQFYALFKIWLNLAIPVTKWASVGLCLVPREKVEPQTVNYVLRWILVNYQLRNFTRIAFVLDWLTAAMEVDYIDMKSLDLGYEIFISFLNFEILTPHVLKLVYTLTKPVDVKRTRVLSLLQLTKIRDGKKSKARQINVLLSLFKSYKPECVPESVPATSVHSAFKKLRPPLVERFQRSQITRNALIEEPHRLVWTLSINEHRGRGQRLDPLVPNMEVINIGSTQYSNEGQKSHLDFTDASALVRARAQGGVGRAGRLRALLANDVGVALLAAEPPHARAFLAHTMHHALMHCLRNESQYKYEEKAHFLSRLAFFQRTMMQGAPVVTAFLAQYLPLWNASDYFSEILELVQWVSLDSREQWPFILAPLARVHCRAEPLQRCAILNALTTLYCNLAYSSSRESSESLDEERAQQHSEFMTHLMHTIGQMCTNSLQIDPKSATAGHACLWALERSARAELRHARPALHAPPALALALPLLAPSATLLDRIALLLTLYQQLYRHIKKKWPHTNLDDQRKVLADCTADYISALWDEKPLSVSESGMIFRKLRPDLIKKLKRNVPNAEGSFGLGSHYALAPYSYMECADLDVDFNVRTKSIITEANATKFPNMEKFFAKCGGN